MDDSLCRYETVSKPFIFQSCKPMLEPRCFSSLIQTLKDLFGEKEATAGLFVQKVEQFWKI